MVQSLATSTVSAIGSYVPEQSIGEAHFARGRSKARVAGPRVTHGERRRRIAQRVAGQVHVLVDDDAIARRIRAQGSARVEVAQNGRGSIDEQLDSRNSSQRSSSITSPIDDMTSQGVSGGSAHVRSSSQRSSSHMRSGSGRSNTYRSSGDKADGGESSALAHSSSFNTAGSLRREQSRCVLMGQGHFSAGNYL